MIEKFVYDIPTRVLYGAGSLKDLHAEVLPRRVLSEEAARAFQAAGGEAGDAEAWVASSLALSYVDYARQAAEPADVGAYLRIVRESSSKMLGYYGGGGS